MAWISFSSALLCRGKKTLMTARVSMLLKSRQRPWHASELVSFLVGLTTYQHPGSRSAWQTDWPAMQSHPTRRKTGHERFKSRKSVFTNVETVMYTIWTKKKKNQKIVRWYFYTQVYFKLISLLRRFRLSHAYPYFRHTIVLQLQI